MNRNNLEKSLLREVEEALARVKEGTYGVCQECEEPISPKRLQALPWAQVLRPLQGAAGRHGQRVLTIPRIKTKGYGVAPSRLPWPFLFPRCCTTGLYPRPKDAHSSMPSSCKWFVIFLAVVVPRFLTDGPLAFTTSSPCSGCQLQVPYSVTFRPPAHGP